MSKDVIRCHKATHPDSGGGQLQHAPHTALVTVSPEHYRVSIITLQGLHLTLVLLLRVFL